MPFPEVTRVIYNKNPLDEVICQLKFPPILKIDTEIPVEFQEKVRAKFPMFSEKSEWQIAIPPEAQGKIPPEILQQAMKSSGIRNYQFSSEDEQWQINLTRGFVALSAKKYQRWEQFKEMLEIPLKALINIYAPDYFLRVGLRYIDVINRSVLNLTDVSWNELLQPHILGILGAPEVASKVKNFETTHDIGLADGESLVRIITKFVKPVDDDEICFKIDSDFYRHKTELSSYISILDYLNKRASRLIQWCITRRLHEAMEPKSI